MGIIAVARLRGGALLICLFQQCVLTERAIATLQQRLILKLAAGKILCISSARSVTKEEIYISVLPSLPSTPSRVPSGHMTKSSILYLHSPTVRPKDIVRLSGDPLI